jgi:hypothetical protein
MIFESPDAATVANLDGPDKPPRTVETHIRERIAPPVARRKLGR